MASTKSDTQLSRNHVAGLLHAALIMSTLEKYVSLLHQETSGSSRRSKTTGSRGCKHTSAARNLYLADTVKRRQWKIGTQSWTARLSDAGSGEN